MGGNSTLGRPESNPDELNVQNVDQRDPAADVAAAISHHDFRFVTTMGLGVAAPGLRDNLFDNYTTRFGTKMVAGTSDAEELYTSDIADEYANIYNSILLRYLRLHHLADHCVDRFKAPTTKDSAAK